MSDYWLDRIFGALDAIQTMMFVLMVFALLTVHNYAIMFAGITYMAANAIGYMVFYFFVSEEEDYSE